MDVTSPNRIVLIALDLAAEKNYQEPVVDDIKKIIHDTAKETTKEVSQELGVLIEDVQSDVKHTVEPVDSHSRRLGQWLELDI